MEKKRPKRKPAKTIKPEVTARFDPSPFQIHTLWCGLYRGLFDVIVFFAKKPKHYLDVPELDTLRGNFIDHSAERTDENVHGAMYLDEFRRWFIVKGLDSQLDTKTKRPKYTKIHEDDLFKITLTLPCANDDGLLLFDYHALE